MQKKLITIVACAALAFGAVCGAIAAEAKAPAVQEVQKVHQVSQVGTLEAPASAVADAKAKLAQGDLAGALLSLLFGGGGVSLAMAAAVRKVRVLVDVELDGVKYKPNHLVSFPEALAKVLIDQGQADASKGAVAYCEGELGLKAIPHEGAAEAAVRAELDKLEGELAQLKKDKRSESDATKKAAIDKRIAEVREAIAAGEAKLEGGE